MYKYVLFFALIIFSSCKSDESQELTKNNLPKKETILSKKDVSAINFTDIVLDKKAATIAQDWTAYLTITNAVKQVKSLSFDFFKKENEQFKTTFDELNTNIPEMFDSQPIKVRLIVLETKFYRLRDELAFRKKLLKSDIKYIEELLVSYSNLNLLINKKLEKEAQIIIKPE